MLSYVDFNDLKLENSGEVVKENVVKDRECCCGDKIACSALEVLSYNMIPMLVCRIKAKKCDR